MGIQQGLCSITPNYLLAAWKEDPLSWLPPPAGDHFPLGIEDQIAYASFALPIEGLALSPSDQWTVIGTVPGNTSNGPSLVCDQNLSPSGPGPSVYAIWKGEERDTRVFFSRLTLPLTSEGVASNPASQPWQQQQLYQGATSVSGPSMAFVGPSSGQQPLLFTVWNGLANGQPGPSGDKTLWYSVTPIPSDPGYVDALVLPSAMNYIPGASSATGASVTATVTNSYQWNVWVMWFDTVTGKWSYIDGEVDGTTLLWDYTGPTPISYPSLPNAAGYSVAPFALLESDSTDITGMYAAWSDEAGKIWVTGVWNLLIQNPSPGPPTPMPGRSGQATGNSGCALFPVYVQDFDTNPAGIGCTFLFAMWADTNGQLQYAASDGFSWQYVGTVADATTAPDFGLEYTWPIRFPIHLPGKI